MVDLSFVKEVFMKPPQAHVSYLTLLNRYYQRSQSVHEARGARRRPNLPRTKKIVRPGS